MTKIESQTTQIEASKADVFTFISDFRNFDKLMPAQVSNWEADKDTCSFTVNGMATIGMKIEEKIPNDQIRIVSHGKTPFPFTLLVNLKETGANSCESQLLFNADMNMMVKMMVEKPLTNFFNVLSSSMKNIPGWINQEK